MKQLIGTLVIIICSTSSLYSQSLEEAKKLYLEGKYAEALPAFEKAIKSSPKNASYNQWYGNCLLETGKPEEAEKYLEFASSKNIPEASEALGKLYFYQYRFEESVEAYELYIAALKKKKNETEISGVTPLLNKSKRAARMLSRCENIQIIDSVIVDKNSFLQKYPLSEEAGSLKNSINIPGSVVYENQLKDSRYYAKPDAAKMYKLFTQTSLQGKWADEKALTIPSDSSANDNFPFVLADGVTIYYASTGHESIGGYDLFVTRYNLNKDTYLAPEQLGMPFNSIYNDYMLAIDEFNGIGYFATDRFQSDDKVVVYTFIPNEEIKTVESEDSQLLASRAKITSIKDTWIAGADYGGMLRKISQSNQKGSEKKQKDFEFVINDNIVYYTLDDFESDSAKQLFVASQSQKTQRDELEAKLEAQRQEYAKGNKSKASSIISQEQQLDKLYNDYQETVIKARNTEIKYLRQNQNKK